jgi:serine/threonine protein kinase
MFDLSSGTTLNNNNYQIEKTLGIGGFGITYEGKYCQNQFPVAIKENWFDKGVRQGTFINWVSLTPQQKQEEIEKFKQEAKILAQCIHPNLVGVYDYFEDNNTAYIVMDLIQGNPLVDYLIQWGNLPEEQVIYYGLQVACALQVVHNNNYIHRDIKPHNILITPEHKAVLIDFGATREYNANRTGKMTQILTPGYAPIEQYRSIDKRGAGTDIYALCATMYQSLTGYFPEEAVSRYPQDCLTFPSNYVKIHPFLEQIILKGMARELENRFLTTTELINALTQLQTEIKGRLIYLKRGVSITEFNLNPQDSLIGIASLNPNINIDLENFSDSDTVSRQHGQIFRQGKQWKIQDLNSTNGIFIKPYGKTQFSAKINQVENLNCGDEIAFGKVRFLFQTF